MDDEILFGRYRLVERAGTGGTAHVWRAIDMRTGETVAVKRLHPLVVVDDAARVRLVREFRALRGLDDPSIVRVRDVEIGPREAALILDLVAGPSLKERLATGPPVSTSEALDIVENIARALDVAHDAGIVHRDVTPANVLLDPHLGARLTDFGIARATEDATVATATGTVVGTFGYLAPERLRGAETTPASDMYALGALAWELLAGHPPFAATDPLSLAREVDAGPPRLPGYREPVDAVIRGAMASDPDRRPGSASDFAAALHRAVAEGDPAAGTETVVVEAVPSGVAPEASSARSGRRAAAGIALAGMLGALAVMAAASPGPGPLPTPHASVTGIAAPASPSATPAANPTARPTATTTTRADTGGNASGKGHGKGKGKGKGH